MVAYALSCLQLAGDERTGNPYADEMTALPVARRIADLSGRNFLIAGMVARSHGLFDDQAADPEQLSFRPTVDSVVTDYLQHISPVGGLSPEHALTALAFAEPPGMPLNLWRLTIDAIYGTKTSITVLTRFARSEAANFLIETSGHDRLTAFQLSHPALKDALLRARSQTTPWTEDQRAITVAFISHGRKSNWTDAPSYLFRSLTSHAASGGMIDDLLNDDAYLRHADLQPMPGQLTLPGMPSPATAGASTGGQVTLPGLEFPPAHIKAHSDSELDAVAEELRGLDGDGSRMGAAIRGALDMLLDGQHTGRYRWDQLHKTEKTNAGTLIEIALARALRLADGTVLDYTIAGIDVDCSFSHRLGGWMIPPEATGKLLLLIQASDEDGTWSAGLLRADAENLRAAGNRNGKRALNDRGRAAVRWLHARAPLQENALIRLPQTDVDAIFALPSGQQRVNELFRRAQRMRVSRTVVATVAMQDDYMKRVRDGGGARDQLRAEGIVIFGDYAGDQVLASALGLPRPGPGEFVSARLVPFSGIPSEDGDYARSIRLAEADWRLASADDPSQPVPVLPASLGTRQSSRRTSVPEPYVVVFTALGVEYEAIRDYLDGPIWQHEERGTLYEVGALPGVRGSWHVALAQAGPGSTTAAVQLERAVSVFAPEVALFLGVADGRRDVARGDVVVAQTIYDYEQGKSTLEGYQPRMKTHSPAYRLLQRAQLVARENRWQQRIQPGCPDPPPRCFVKPIVTSDRVIADQSEARLLARYAGDALAVETEGHGFLAGAYLNREVEALVIRGISDLLAGKDQASDEYWQLVASRHAVAFAVEFLDSLGATLT